jgi:uncharacterized protein (DUF2236 family)
MARDANAVVEAAALTLRRDDLGLFGPTSVTWRLRSHATHVVAGLRGLLIQALHPVAMAAIDQHSEYRLDPWGRATNTTRYVLTTTFSATPVAEAAAERVRAIHAQVRGVDLVTGRAYAADDADLLLWVHCAGVSSELATWDTFHAPLDTVASDRFVAEQVRSAELVGLNAANVPRTVAALDEYMASAPTQLTEPARRFAESLVTVAMPLTVRPFWLQHLAATVIALPNDVRDLYGFPRWLPTGSPARATLRLAFWAGQTAFGVLPGIRRTWLRLASLGDC